jgi:hypothetical protein
MRKAVISGKCSETSELFAYLLFSYSSEVKIIPKL